MNFNEISNLFKVLIKSMSISQISYYALRGILFNLSSCWIKYIHNSLYIITNLEVLRYTFFINTRLILHKSKHKLMTYGCWKLLTTFWIVLNTMQTKVDSSNTVTKLISLRVSINKKISLFFLNESLIFSNNSFSIDFVSQNLQVIKKILYPLRRDLE